MEAEVVVVVVVEAALSVPSRPAKVEAVGTKQKAADNRYRIGLRLLVP